MGEVEELREEVERLRNELRVEELHADNSDCDVCDHLSIEDLVARLEEVTSEKEMLRRQVEAVRALPGAWDEKARRASGRNDWKAAEIREWCADDLRAALDG